MIDVRSPSSSARRGPLSSPSSPLLSLSRGLRLARPKTLASGDQGTPGITHSPCSAVSMVYVLPWPSGPAVWEAPDSLYPRGKEGSTRAARRDVRNSPPLSPPPESPHPWALLSVVLIAGCPFAGLPGEVWLVARKSAALPLSKSARGSPAGAAGTPVRGRSPGRRMRHLCPR